MFWNGQVNVLTLIQQKYWASSSCKKKQQPQVEAVQWKMEKKSLSQGAGLINIWQNLVIAAYIARYDILARYGGLNWLPHYIIL